MNRDPIFPLVSNELWAKRTSEIIIFDEPKKAWESGEIKIPEFLKKPSFLELVQDRASEGITYHDDKKRVLEIFNELYELSTRLMTERQLAR